MAVVKIDKKTYVVSEHKKEVFWRIQDRYYEPGWSDASSLIFRGQRHYAPLNEFTYPPLVVGKLAPGDQFTLKGENVILHHGDGKFLGIEVVNEEEYVFQVGASPYREDVLLGFRIVDGAIRTH